MSVELCSLHFYPSDANEDIVANLLFADGAAAVTVCGNKNEHAKNKIVLNIDDIGSASIPNTSELMKWDVTSTAFRMHLSTKVVNAIKNNINEAVTNFLETKTSETNYWAIHPGGVKIVEAVQESLHLNKEQVEDSMSILQQYGNMSSATILFILNNIFNKIKKTAPTENQNIFSCAFGPGLNIEMVRLSSLDTSKPNKINPTVQNHVLEA